ncbi:arginyltransferase [Celerinatantimonas diazotrophica]|uniref:Aspartate/glutamate leucyltransferase n=1 Tax=Celerinatantimonas diazotrophica TaxID=412034 RepID=A0A4R1J7V7_9GAMM|nr:arginyltransferase [Celerinatantimonas diazotrophica]TCK46516.1 arginine-tRNA-protein transferase [Celerinatantimonas diazotrophica]CAG9296566.1 Aspartate/glutamate leucyltransferase [Celerinatantimonas diazotrophica]
MKSPLKIGMTPEHDCPYLSAHQARELVVFMTNDAEYSYQEFIEQGFRRSGNDVYRPHCIRCQQCQSLKVDVQNFTPTRSQKRVLKRNQDLSFKWAEESSIEQFALYKRYLSCRHNDGGMLQHSFSDYRNFLQSFWQTTRFLEVYLDGKLVAVAVTDWLSFGLSAVYSFFAPEIAKRSPGHWLILNQIQQAKEHQKQWLYLGYQIDSCQKMNYKQHYYPHQRFIYGQWQASI